MLTPSLHDNDDREWRQAVIAQLTELGKVQASTAVVLERVSARLDVLDDWRNEARRVAREGPERRAAFSGSLASWVVAIMAALALLLSVIQHIHLS